MSKWRLCDMTGIMRQKMADGQEKRNSDAWTKREVVQSDQKCQSSVSFGWETSDMTNYASEP